MKYLLSILCLFILSCDEDSNIHGCLDSQACNYNPNASIDNNSCIYEEEGYDCDGNDLCDDNPIEWMDGDCDDGNTNLFEAIVYGDGITQNAIIKLNEPIGCCYTIPESSNTYDCYAEDGQDGVFCNYDSGSIIKIISESFFGNNCAIYYDSENYFLTGYSITTLNEPDGTGQFCNPDFLNIPSENGFQLELDLPSYGNVPFYINAVPNPFQFNCCSEQANNYIRFTHLPQECIIDIYDVNYNLIKIINHNSIYDSNEFWDLKNNQNQLVDSGIYIYEITSDGEKIFRNTVIIKMLDD